MAIVVGNNPIIKLVKLQEDSYIQESCTELRIKSIAVDQKNTIFKINRGTLTSTPNKKVNTYITGQEPIDITLETYVHPLFIPTATYSSSERFLWDSLTGINSILSISKYIVSFKNNTNKLKRLNIYFELDKTIYGLYECVVTEAKIDLNINTIPTISWKLVGRSLSPSTGVTFSGICLDYKSNMFLRNKLSVLNAQRISDFREYNIPIINGSITFKNDVGFQTRTRLGRYTMPESHYISSRDTYGELEIYLSSLSGGVNNSLVLYDDIINYPDKNTFYKIDLWIGGNNGIDPNMYLSFPAIKLEIPQSTLNIPVSMTIPFHAEETSSGLNDDVKINYNPEYYDPKIRDDAGNIINDDNSNNILED